MSHSNSPHASLIYAPCQATSVYNMMYINPVRSKGRTYKDIPFCPPSKLLSDPSSIMVSSFVKTLEDFLERAAGATSPQFCMFLNLFPIISPKRMLLKILASSFFFLILGGGGG